MGHYLFRYVEPFPFEAPEMFVIVNRIVVSVKSVMHLHKQEFVSRGLRDQVNRIGWIIIHVCDCYKYGYALLECICVNDLKFFTDREIVILGEGLSASVRLVYCPWER